jgi:hypothetical protein
MSHKLDSPGFGGRGGAGPCEYEGGAVVCTENFIRVDEVKESPKLTE